MRVVHDYGRHAQVGLGLSTQTFPLSRTESCLLSNNITDYYFVSQGKTTIPSVDDGEELTITDVSGAPREVSRRARAALGLAACQCHGRRGLIASRAGHISVSLAAAYTITPFTNLYIFYV